MATASDTMDDDSPDHEAAADGDDADGDGDSDDAETDSLQRDETGQFPTKVSEADVRVYLEEHRGAFTAELAEAFDVSDETIRRKCYRLANQGEIRARQGDGGPIFWQPTLTRESE